MSDKRTRHCSLPEFAGEIDPRVRLGILTDNGQMIDVCPTGLFTDTTLRLWGEYMFAREFGGPDDLTEQEFQAFLILGGELAKAQRKAMEKKK